MKFDMSRAWNDAVAMIGRNREVLMIVAGLFFFVPTVLTTFVTPEMAQPPADADPERVFEAMMQQISTLYADYWWLFLLGAIIQGIGTLALLALLSDSTRPTLGEAIKTGAMGFLPYILASLLLGLLVIAVGAALVGLPAMVHPALGAIGGIAALVAIIYMIVKFSLLAPAIGVERIFNPIAALHRSWRLTKGNSLRLFLFYILLLIVYLVISAILAAIIGLVVAAAGTGAVSLAVQSVLAGILGAAVTVVMVAVLAAVHRQMAGPSSASVSETFD